MFTVICCHGYYVVGKRQTFAEAKTLADSHVDGTYGSFVVDADGRHLDDNGRLYAESCGDAATQTGMYDRL